MLAFVLLYACSNPNPTEEGSVAMAPQVINITFSEDGEVITAPEDNPRQVNPGDTVIWSFEGDVAEKKLEVRPKDENRSPFEGLPLPVVGQSNQIRGQISSIVVPGAGRFEYDIFKGEIELEWADGSNGGQFEPPPSPPGTPVRR